MRTCKCGNKIPSNQTCECELLELLIRNILDRHFEGRKITRESHTEIADVIRGILETDRQFFDLKIQFCGEIAKITGNINFTFEKNDR